MVAPMENNKHKKTYYEEMYGSAGAATARRSFLDVLYERFKRFELHREDAVARMITPGDRLLDIGCGNGSFVFKAFHKFRETQGIDIASNRVEEARRIRDERYPAANITFRSGDIDEGLPYEDESFDTVTMIASFEHIFDPYYAFAEAARVLKKGGEVVIEVPNIVWLPRRLSLLFGILPKTSNESGWDGGHLHYFTVGSLKAFVEEQGFQVVRVTGSGIGSAVRNIWVSLLSGDIIIQARKQARP